MANTNIPKFVQERFAQLVRGTAKEVARGGIFRAEVLVFDRSGMTSGQYVYWSKEAFLTLTVGTFRFSNYLEETESYTYEISSDNRLFEGTKSFNSLDKAEWEAVDILRGKKVAQEGEKAGYSQDEPAEKYRQWTS